MTPAIIITTIIAYFAVLLVAGRLAARGGANADFFTGGRRMPWPMVAIAAIGAAISGVTFISVPGMVVGKGWSYLQMMLGFIGGYAVVAWVLVPLFYKQGLVSIYGYLGQRFGRSTYKTGAWIFFVSKMLGAAVRFYVVCAVLQLLVFGPLGLPFALNLGATIALIWLYTVRGGVKSVIVTDVVKSICLVTAVVLSIIFIAKTLGLGPASLVTAIAAHPTSEAFHWANPMEADWIGKQLLAGVFMVVVMTGLDQDMMQRNLACRDSHSSCKNVMVSAVMQFFVIGLFLVLGTLLVMLVEREEALSLPARSDELYGMVAAWEGMPAIVGVVFILGLVSAAYSAAGSALTSLTTSFTVDILGHDPATVSRRRRMSVHLAMTLVMAAVIAVFYSLSSQDAISAVYLLASYTYGPILGLFAYGLFTRRAVVDRWVPLACIAAPVAAWAVSEGFARWAGYHIGFELLLINAAFTVGFLHLISKQLVVDNA